MGTVQLPLCRDGLALSPDPAGLGCRSPCQACWPGAPTFPGAGALQGHAPVPGSGGHCSSSSSPRRSLAVPGRRPGSLRGPVKGLLSNSHPTSRTGLLTPPTHTVSRG